MSWLQRKVASPGIGSSEGFTNGSSWLRLPRRPHQRLQATIFGPTSFGSPALARLYFGQAPVSLLRPSPSPEPTKTSTHGEGGYRRPTAERHGFGPLRRQPRPAAKTATGGPWRSQLASVQHGKLLQFRLTATWCAQAGFGPPRRTAQVWFVLQQKYRGAEGCERDGSLIPAPPPTEVTTLPTKLLHLDASCYAIYLIFIATSYLVTKVASEATCMRRLSITLRTLINSFVGSSCPHDFQKAS
jgi:hypothetical protein